MWVISVHKNHGLHQPLKTAHQLLVCLLLIILQSFTVDFSASSTTPFLNPIVAAESTISVTSTVKHLMPVVPTLAIQSTTVQFDPMRTTLDSKSTMTPSSISTDTTSSPLVGKQLRNTWWIHFNMSFTLYRLYCCCYCNIIFHCPCCDRVYCNIHSCLHLQTEEVGQKYSNHNVYSIVICILITYWFGLPYNSPKNSSAIDLDLCFS